MQSGTPWGSTMWVEISLADPSADPVWTDITQWVRPNTGAIDLASGRQTDLPTADPGRGSLTLEDRDGRWTVGNTASPYHPWWAPGCRVRIRETFGARTFTYLDGYVQMPTAMATTQVVGEENDADVTVTVALVDELGHLQDAGAFVSTLGAHIIGSAPVGTLVAYYPLGDDNSTRQRDLAAGRPPLEVSATSSSLGDQTSARATISPGAEVVAPGDDLATVQLVPATTDYSGYQYMAHSHIMSASWSGYTTSTAPTLTSGQCLTMIAWVRLDEYDDSQQIFQVGLSSSDWSEQTYINLSRTGVLDSISTEWHLWALDLADSAYHAIVTSGRTTGPVREIVGAQITPTEARMWIGDQEYTIANSGGGWSYPQYHRNRIQGPGPLSGSAAHLQIYIHDEADLTHADFLAQREAGLYGLVRQTTGERIRSIAEYAGIPSSRLGRVDAGVAAMSRADLAGRTPLDALRAAEETEQGRLWMDGSDMVFHDRRRRYDM